MRVSKEHFPENRDIKKGHLSNQLYLGGEEQVPNDVSTQGLNVRHSLYPSEAHSFLLSFLARKVLSGGSCAVHAFPIENASFLGNIKMSEKCGLVRCWSNVRRF